MLRVIIFCVFIWLADFKIEADNADNHTSFANLVESLQAGDDNQKNFRFAIVMDSLSLLAEKVPFHYVPSIIPSGWAFQHSSDSLQIFVAGILNFRFQPCRLIWGVFHPDDVTRGALFFSKDLNSRPPAGFIPRFITASNLYDGANFTSLEIVVGNQTALSIPDVEFKLLLDQLTRADDDNKRDEISELMWSRLNGLLRNPSLFNHTFSDFGRFSTLISPDGLVKICTWNVEYNNRENTFHGAIAVRHDDEIRVFRLIDEFKNIRSPETASLTHNRWFGSVYYDLIQTRHRGKTFYTLLGFNGNNAFSKIRVVDVLTINSNGTPRFASAIISDDRRSRKRLIFEYSSRATMMLRYNHDMRMIVMDNLAPYEPFHAGDFRFYGPDFSHNGLRFEGGKWELHNDIDLRNPPPPRQNRR